MYLSHTGVGVPVTQVLTYLSHRCWRTYCTGVDVPVVQVSVYIPVIDAAAPQMQVQLCEDVRSGVSEDGVVDQREELHQLQPNTADEEDSSDGP